MGNSGSYDAPRQRPNEAASVYAQKSLGYKATKRVFDVVASAAALVVLSPLLAGTAIAVFVDSGRPIIFRAPRKGKDGKDFIMYKFRSMEPGASERQDLMVNRYNQGSVAFKAEADPRITRVGRFIRKYFIDELPQLVNVIKGDMSIVGPRAIQQVRDYTPYEEQRLAVAPGLTCYWQVREDKHMPWDEWLELDLAYIRDMCIATDLSIIGKTVLVVLRGEGDY